MHMLGLLAIIAALAGLPAVAAAADRDRDRLPDRWERKNALSTAANSRAGDPDRDAVDNLNEWRERTHPRDADSDNDGRRDGREDADRDRLSNAAEDRSGTDPRDRDSDDDGVRDGAERAGLVSALRKRKLTIALANGRSIRGRVAGRTEVYCKTERQAEDEWLLGQPLANEEPVYDWDDGVVWDDGDDGALDDGASDEGRIDDPADLDGMDDSAGSGGDIVLAGVDEDDGADLDSDSLEDDAGDDPDLGDLGSDGDSAADPDFERLDQAEDGLEIDDAFDRCPRRRLRKGVRVQEATLRTLARGAVFVEVELIR